VTITSPLDGSPYPRIGDTVYNCTALITDDEQNSSQLACAWQTILHHNDHTHNEPVDTNCVTTTVISSVGCDGETYFYAIILTVTDSAGLSTTNEVRLYPDCALIVPGLTWANPAAISYGTPLGSSQLNATADVAGTFTFNPPAGTILSPGTHQPLSTTFTPGDAVDFTNATATVFIDVLAPLVSIAINSSNQVSLRWNAFAGKTYRIQYASGPSTNSWSTLGSDVTATNSTASITDTLGAVQQRFYRVLLTN